MANSSTNPKVLFTGSCACSRLTYHITSLPTASNACHCIPCRKLSGSAFQAFFDIPPSSTIFFDAQHTPPSQPFSIDSVPGLSLVRLSPYAERGVCASCHGWLSMRYHVDGARNIALTLGSVDDDSYAGDDAVRAHLTVKKHIFAPQRAAWMGEEWLRKEELAGMVCERFPAQGFEDAMREAAK